VSAFLAWLGEMIAVVVYKETFPFRDIFIAEDVQLDFDYGYYFMVLASCLSAVAFVGFYYEADPGYFKGTGNMDKRLLAVPALTFLLCTLCCAGLASLHWVQAVDDERTWYGLLMYTVNGTDYKIEELGFDFPNTNMAQFAEEVAAWHFSQLACSPPYACFRILRL
jgi:hypothetical protein